MGGDLDQRTVEHHPHGWRTRLIPEDELPAILNDGEVLWSGIIEGKHRYWITVDLPEIDNGRS